MRDSAINRVLKKVVIIPESGCWIFMGALNEAGYGIVGLGGRGAGNDRAHRITYRHFKGDTPDGMYVCHRCDVPSCCNPEHLFLGTSADNNRDMRSKGRGANPPRNYHDKGERRYNAKLTEEKVREIRKKFSSGVSDRVLSKKYGVSRSVIYRVAKKLTWRHVV